MRKEDKEKSRKPEGANNMTVAELIEILGTLPDNATVLIQGDGGPEVTAEAVWPQTTDENGTVTEIVIY